MLHRLILVINVISEYQNNMYGVHGLLPVPLRITQQPVSSIEVQEGSTLELSCEAEGFPYPIYTWFHAIKTVSLSSNGMLVKTDVR